VVARWLGVELGCLVDVGNKGLILSYFNEGRIEKKKTSNF